MLPQQLEAYGRSEHGRAYLQLIMEQAKHRMDLEQTVVRGDERRAHLGQWFALLIALTFCGAGTWLVLNGHDWAGGTMATGTVLSLVTVFVTGSTQRRAERTEKAKIMAGQQGQPEQEKPNVTDATPQLPGIEEEV